jgi:GNAT superfamily N-acetyltransferase
VLSFRRERADESPGRELLAAMVATLEELYAGRDVRPGPTATPEEMAPPGGAFLVGYDGERPVACGGVRRLEDGLAEIKRMYVVPGARGRGIARALLSALEDAARELGYDRVRLDTGPRQPHARALYESAGYAEVPDYNGNPYAFFWGEKRL